MKLTTNSKRMPAKAKKTYLLPTIGGVKLI
jgi:hypothetical protein